MRLAKKKKYNSICNDILSRIESGEWRASEKLPSQAELAKRYNASLGTIQKSLAILEGDGVLFRKHGSGTYITVDAPENEEIVNFRFRDPDTSRLLPLYTKVENLTEVSDDGPWRTHLDDRNLIAVRRIVNVDLRFSTESVVYLRKSQFSDLLEMPPYELDGHELTRVIEAHSLPSLRFIYRIRGTTLPDEVCRLNHLPEASPGLLWEILGFTYRDQANWYQQVKVPLVPYPLEVLGVTKWHPSGSEEKLRP